MADTGYRKDMTNQLHSKFERIVRISLQKTPLPGFEPGSTGSNPDSGLTRRQRTIDCGWLLHFNVSWKSWLSSIGVTKQNEKCKIEGNAAC